MSTFTLSSSSGSVLTVSNLTTPVSFLLAYQTYTPAASSTYTHKCRRGYRENITVSCGAGGVKMWVASCPNPSPRGRVGVTSGGRTSGS